MIFCPSSYETMQTGMGACAYCELLTAIGVTMELTGSFTMITANAPSPAAPIAYTQVH